MDLIAKNGDENGVKKRKKRKKEVQHEDFPGSHPSWYYTRPSTLIYGVLMGSGALVLVSSHLSNIARSMYIWVSHWAYV